MSEAVPLLFTHDDLDGIGGVVMARARYGDQLEFRRCSTSQINDAVAAYLAHPDGRPLLFTDISVNEQVAVTLDRYAAHVAVRLLDHHQTALWLTRYPWATVRLDACGTMLAYEALAPGIVYADLARVIDDYDRWQQRDPRSSELNRLFEMIGADRFLRRFVGSPEPDFTADERLLLDIESERLARYLEKVEGTLVEFDLGGQRAGVCYADHSITEAAAALLAQRGLGLIAVINLHDRKVSLRSRGAIDVSALAQRLGGGGHRQAAGFTLPDQLPKQLQESIVRGIREASRDR